MIPGTNTFEYETRQLEKLHYAVETRITRDELFSARVETYYDYIAHHLVLKLRGFIWIEPLEIVRYPADWWQAFKERWFSAWMKARWPVRYEVFDVQARYPTFRYAVPVDNSYLEIARRS